MNTDSVTASYPEGINEILPILVVFVDQYGGNLM
jgi:hypothetical protein